VACFAATGVDGEGLAVFVAEAVSDAAGRFWTDVAAIECGRWPARRTTRNNKSRTAHAPAVPIIIHIDLEGFPFRVAANADRIGWMTEALVSGTVGITSAILAERAGSKLLRGGVGEAGSCAGRHSFGCEALHGVSAGAALVNSLR